MSEGDRDMDERLPMGVGVIKNVAVGMSRRQFGRAAAALVGALTLGVVVPIQAVAAACRICYGPCARCSSCTGTCCSPNGRYCYRACCTCWFDCVCATFHARETVCDDGAHGRACNLC